MQSWFGLRRLVTKTGLCLCFIFAPRPAAADVTANFIGHSTGGTISQWTDPTQWSTNPYYPNNGNPAGVNFNVSFSAQATIVLSSPVTVDDFSLSNGDLMLNANLAASSVNISGGSLTMFGAVLSAATFNISGLQTEFDGTVENATITQSGGYIPSINVSNVTLNSNLFVGPFGGLVIQNGFQANGHEIGNDEQTGYIVVEGNGSAYTLSNVTVVLGNGGLGNNYLQTDDTPGTSLIIAPSTTVVGAIGSYIGGTNLPEEARSPSIINKGTISSRMFPYGPIINPVSFINEGTITASDGGSVDIAPSGTSWTNNGTLSMTSGGYLVVEESLVLGKGSILDEQVYNSMEQCIVEGSLNLGDDAILNLSLLPGTVFAQPIEIMSYTGTLSGQFASVTPGFTISYATPGEILVTAVPEPAALAVLGAASTLLLGRGIRSNRKCI